MRPFFRTRMHPLNLDACRLLVWRHTSTTVGRHRPALPLANATKQKVGGRQHHLKRSVSNSSTTYVRTGHRWRSFYYSSNVPCSVHNFIRGDCRYVAPLHLARAPYFSLQLTRRLPIIRATRITNGVKRFKGIVTILCTVRHRRF